MGCGQQMKREKSGKEWTHTYIYIEKAGVYNLLQNSLSLSLLFPPSLSLYIYICKNIVEERGKGYAEGKDGDLATRPYYRAPDCDCKTAIFVHDSIRWPRIQLSLFSVSPQPPPLPVIATTR